MRRMAKFLLPIFFLTALSAFLSSPAYPAYGTISEVDVFAPSPVDVDQEIVVQAKVYTSAAG